MGTIAAAGSIEASEASHLVRRAALGDERAFDQLIAPRLDRCFRLSFSILGNEADAADATQEAVVAAWRQLPRLRDHAAFDAWLNRIVANAARMARRHRVRLREVPVEPVDVEQTPDRVDDAAHRQIDDVAGAEAIGRAFDRLTEQHRLILVLHHVEGRPVDEIARSLGIAGGTVKWRLHQARTALERAMETEA